MDHPFTKIMAALAWFGLLAFAIYMIGWSMNLWWILGW